MVFLSVVATGFTPRGAMSAPQRDEAPTTRPADAIVLFDGKDMEAWESFDTRKKLGFHLVDGALDLDKNNAVTRQAFGDFRMHVEFLCPEEPPDVTGQKHGNSGVYLHDRYEIQILGHRGDALPDEHEVGAIYGIKRPDKLATRPDGTWQTFDCVFHAPRFDAAGKKVRDARVTLHHNGILIHNDASIPHPTGAARGEEAPTGPIRLQDKNHPVLFRNIWVVPLKNNE
jgi:hypothetical protein